MENKKILDIKIEEKDFLKIQTLILTHIAYLQKEKYDMKAKDIEKIDFEIYECKMLLAKLEVTKWYN